MIEKNIDALSLALKVRDEYPRISQAMGEMAAAIGQVYLALSKMGVRRKESINAVCAGVKRFRQSFIINMMPGGDVRFGRRAYWLKDCLSSEEIDLLDYLVTGDVGVGSAVNNAELSVSIGLSIGMVAQLTPHQLQGNYHALISGSQLVELVLALALPKIKDDLMNMLRGYCEAVEYATARLESLGDLAAPMATAAFVSSD
jgi:hypothetical protein